MEFSVRPSTPASQKSACAILPLFEGKDGGGIVSAMDPASRTMIRRLIKDGDASAKPGQCRFVPGAAGAPAKRLLLVGAGSVGAWDDKRLAAATAAAIGALRSTGVKEAISYLTAVGGPPAKDAARQSVQSARAALYRFDEQKSRVEPRMPLARLHLAFPPAALSAAREGINEGLAVAAGMDLARDLGNRPPNVCTPSHLAATAKGIAAKYKGFRVKIIDEAEMKRLGMGALLAVTRGAVEPAKLIVLEYRGAPRSAPIALCGKGITFDTGGISLKPPPKMDEMKFDMCGAAAVLGVMTALGELQPRLHVVALIPTCENMPGGEATRPGDIVKTLSGQTVEILNTDAEGRLVLCDAMSYALRYQPSRIIDVATLTGACVVALGHQYTGLFSNDDALAAALLDAGRRSLDPAWRMPVNEEYGDSLKSNFADFANSGSREGGASIAANFLSRFVAETPWAHLDIAGVAWNQNSNKGATGRPVPLLTSYLLGLAAE